MLHDIELKLKDAAGTAVAVELRMRLIAKNLPESVRKEYKIEKYWNCQLSLLDKAIINVFYDKLEPTERQKLAGFPCLRNALVHADFVTVMESMNITPTGRYIFSGGRRNVLKRCDIQEAVLSIDRSGGFEAFIKQANEVNEILDGLYSINFF